MFHGMEVGQLDDPGAGKEPGLHQQFLLAHAVVGKNRLRILGSQQRVERSVLGLETPQMIVARGEEGLMLVVHLLRQADDPTSQFYLSDLRGGIWARLFAGHWPGSCQQTGQEQWPRSNGPVTVNEAGQGSDDPSTRSDRSGHCWLVMLLTRDIGHWVFVSLGQLWADMRQRQGPLVVGRLIEVKVQAGIVQLASGHRPGAAVEELLQALGAGI